jgi:hypothetical protein
MDASMLDANEKMTGLDLASRSNEKENRRSEEMLTTPKIPDSAGTLMSPKFLSYSSTSYSSSSTSRLASTYGGGETTNGSLRINGCDDMLMTPVLTTPNTADLWSNKRSSEVVDFSPENLSSTADLELGVREPPKDLPMDSDIGLRSPCDGLLAKRRKQVIFLLLVTHFNYTEGRR